MTHGAPWIGQRRFAAAVAGQPGALNAGEMAVEVGDDAEQGGPALARAAISGPVIAGGMVAKAGTIKAGGDGASAKVAFGEGAGDRARKAPKLLGGGKRVALRLGK